MIDDVDNVIRSVVSSMQKDASVEAVVAMTPDASLRRYFRVTGARLAPSARSIVAMVFDSVAVPEAGGATSVNSYDAFVQTTEFFATYNVPVPRILFCNADPPVILLEDLGDSLLAARWGQSREILSALYREAIETLLRIQAIPFDADALPFRRAFTEQTYVKEMEEITQFFLAPRGTSPATCTELGVLCGELARELSRFSTTVVHRDYHSWNIMVDSAARVRVIDYQDALVGPRTYDIIGLLNDRDTDAALGSELYDQLVAEYRAQCCTAWKIESDTFDHEYLTALLQRDLKVVGRFAKLVSLRKLDHYGRWIPGTARRVLRTLTALSARGVPYAKALDPILRREMPEFADG